MKRPLLRLCSLLLFPLVFVSLEIQTASAAPSAKDLSAEALMECHKGRVAQAREARLAHFERGQALAERAVALDDQWADAHFALFCTMGEKMRLDGEFLKSIFSLNRVLDALDRTLELDPDHLDALSCKGTFLVRLPALFGGDQERGEELLRQVIRRAPEKSINARLALARSYADRDRHDEAVSLAREALIIAQSLERIDLIPEARTTLAQMSSAGGAAAESHALLARP